MPFSSLSTVGVEINNDFYLTFTNEDGYKRQPVYDFNSNLEHVISFPYKYEVSLSHVRLPLIWRSLPKRNRISFSVRSCNEKAIELKRAEAKAKGPQEAVLPSDSENETELTGHCENCEDDVKFKPKYLGPGKKVPILSMGSYSSVEQFLNVLNSRGAFFAMHEKIADDDDEEEGGGGPSQFLMGNYQPNNADDGVVDEESAADKNVTVRSHFFPVNQCIEFCYSNALQRFYVKRKRRDICLHLKLSSTMAELIGFISRSVIIDRGEVYARGTETFTSFITDQVYIRCPQIEYSTIYCSRAGKLDNCVGRVDLPQFTSSQRHVLMEVQQRRYFPLKDQILSNLQFSFLNQRGEKLDPERRGPVVRTEIELHFRPAVFNTEG